MKPYYEDGTVTIYHADCREVMSYVIADALVTDPPFNVGKDYEASDDRLDGHEYRALMGHVALAGPSRQAWVTPTNRLALFSTLLDGAQPVVIRRGAKGPKRWGWFDQFDLVLVRGKPRRYVSNLWEDIRLKGEGYFFREETYDHPGYTPFPIVARLVALLAGPDEMVLDPFAGTGGTLVAAKAQGCLATGIDLNERYCEIAAERCAQEVLALGAVS